MQEETPNLVFFGGSLHLQAMVNPICAGQRRSSGQTARGQPAERRFQSRPGSTTTLMTSCKTLIEERDQNTNMFVLVTIQTSVSTQVYKITSNSRG